MAGAAASLPSITIHDVTEDNLPATDKDDISDDFEMKRREPKQPSLFPSEELIVPQSLRSMRKAVSAVHAVSLDHSQSLNSRRLFDGFILAAQIDGRRRDSKWIDRVREERISPLFDIRISDLAQLAGIPGKNFERLYEEIDQLYRMTLAWNIVGEDDNIDWEMKSHFLSSYGRGVGRNRGLVRFSFDPAILEIVLEPSRWAHLSLQEMSGLGTPASYALYQNAWRYIGTQNKVTAALPVATWIELLMGPSRYVVEHPDPSIGKRVENYGDFKRRVLLDAMDRVNSIPALSYALQLKEIKSGKRVAKLQFRFVLKQQESLGLPLTWPKDVVQTLESIGYQQRDIEDLSQAHSVEEVGDAIIRLKAAETRMRAAGKSISAKKPYFEGILKNIALGAVGDDQDDDKIAEEVRRQEALIAAEEREKRLRDAFEEHQKALFAAWWFGRKEEERDQDRESFLKSCTAPERIFFNKPLTQSSTGAMALIRNWMFKNQPGLIDAFYPNPEDQSYEAWLAWRLDNTA